MKKALCVLSCLALVSVSSFASGAKSFTKDKNHELNAPHDNGNGNGPSNEAAPGGAGKLLDHGGPVMTNAKVGDIFWGRASKTTAQYVSQVVSFRPPGVIHHNRMLSQHLRTR